MNDESDVRFVDTHSEGYRSYDDLHVLVEEKVLPFCPELAVQTSVVGYRLDAIGHKHVCQLFCRLPVERIDNTAFAFLLNDITDNAFNGLVLLDLRLDLVIKIGPVEGGYEDIRVAEPEIFDDVAFYLRGGRCRKGNDGDFRADLVHHFPQSAVFGPEVMPPFRDTVCFIDGEERYLQVAEKFHVFLLGQRLGRYIEHFGMPVQQVFMHFPDLFFAKRGVEEVGDTVLAAVTTDEVDLVLHQSDQRTNDNSHTFADNGGQLIAKTFATTCRHDDESVLFL